MATGGDDLPPGQWDDELSSWPEDRRNVGARRIAFVTVCGALITLIILTIVFVGNDTKSSARVTTNEVSSSTLSTIGFATSLPVAATATSLGDSTTTTTTTTTTSTTSTTLVGVVVLPEQTTTTAPPEFQYNPAGPKTASAEYVPGNNPPCQPASSANSITFDTPTPGNISIHRVASNITATGSVSPSGDFDATASGGGETDHYVGATTQTGATGTLTMTIPATCAGGMSSSATWTFA